MKPLYVGAFIPLFIFAMVFAAPVSFAGNHPGNGNAFGHFIAPGWLKKNDAPSSEGVSLPPGIDKKTNEDGGEDPEDTTGPVISNVSVDSTDTTATISWDTNEPAEHTAYLSTSSPVDKTATGTLTVSDLSFDTMHEATFDSLTPSTTYFALIEVTDEHGNTSTGSEVMVSTDQAPDTSGPVISDATLDPATSTIGVSWLTNEPATSRVHYSTSTGFALGDPGVSVVEDLSLVTSHDLLLSVLTASTTYYLRIESDDASDNTTLSDEMSTTTTSL